MEFIDLHRVRYIKNRQKCWLVYDQNGKQVFQSLAGETKDAVKNAIGLANRAYRHGLTTGKSKGRQELQHQVTQELQAWLAPSLTDASL